MSIDTVDNIIVQWFNTSFNTGAPEWIGNLVLCFLCILMTIILSGLIGFEREYNGHAAGLRTHILVSLGSCIIMIVSIYGFNVMPGNEAFANRDPARLAAQVITGIGFLGAGTIIQTGISVKGLTTATTLWLSMAVGLACGSGNLVIATLATIIALSVLTMLRKFEKFAARKNPIITLVVNAGTPFIKELISIGSRFGVNIRDVDSQIVQIDGQEALRVNIRCSKVSKASMTAFVDELRQAIKPLELHISTGLM